MMYHKLDDEQVAVGPIDKTGTCSSVTGSRLANDGKDVSVPGSASGFRDNQLSSISGAMDTRGIRELTKNVDWGSNSSESSTSRDRRREVKRQIDTLTILRASVFIEDGIGYRSIMHKVDGQSLRLYRLYYSQSFQWTIYLTLVLLHLLAFFESPSTLSWSSDISKKSLSRSELPFGVCEGIELVLLIILLLDVVSKVHLTGWNHLRASKWLMAYFVVLAFSFCDLVVSLILAANYVYRFRRLLRPFFILQNSSVMKKTVKALRKTLEQVLSVLFLLALHLFFFAIIGMLIFVDDSPYNKPVIDNQTNVRLHADEFDVIGLLGDGGNLTNVTCRVVSESTRESDFFIDFWKALTNLLVLLTTANNPDVMMPAYSENRLYGIYFIAYLFIGLYCFMNMLTAVIYNQFRGYFQNSIGTSLFRRKLAYRTAFSVLSPCHSFNADVDLQSSGPNGVSASLMRTVIEQTDIPVRAKDVMLRHLQAMAGTHLALSDFYDLMHIVELEHLPRKPPIRWRRSSGFLYWLQVIVSHRGFAYFGNLVAVANTTLIVIELHMNMDSIRSTRNSELAFANMVFVAYYILEQLLKCWALGSRRYFWYFSNLYDGSVTVLLLEIGQLFSYRRKTIDHSSAVLNPSGDFYQSVWTVTRLINILIVARLLRIINYIKAMSLVAYTVLDLVKNLRPFIGIFVAVFYSFALLGMMIFQGTVKLPATVNCSISCGSYEQLNYWANNFDDFGSSLVLLWDIMVENNWHVFLDKFRRDTGSGSQVFFVVWWLMSRVIVMNLFTAVILENFITRWDRHQQQPQDRTRSGSLRADQRTPSGVEDAESLNHVRQETEVRTRGVSTHLMTVHDLFRGELMEPRDEELISEIRLHPFLDSSALELSSVVAAESARAAAVAAAAAGRQSGGLAAAGPPSPGAAATCSASTASDGLAEPRRRAALATGSYSVVDDFE